MPLEECLNVQLVENSFPPGSSCRDMSLATTVLPNMLINRNCLQLLLYQLLLGQSYSLRLRYKLC